MRNHTLIRSVSRDDDPVSSWTSARIYLTVTQYRELVIWAGIGEGETFIVVVLMGVIVRVVAVLQVRVGLLGGGVDVGLLVAGLSAVVRALTLDRPVRCTLHESAMP